MNGYFPEAANTPPRPAEERIKEKAQTPPRLLVSAAVFGVLFSYLFAKQLLGLNVLLFVVLLYGFALYNRELFMKRTFREELLVTMFTIPVLFLAILVFTGSTFLNGFSILVILFVMFVQYMVLSGNALYRWYQPLFALDLFFGGINRLLLGLGQFANGSVNGLFKSQSEKKRGALTGIIAGLVLLILIVPVLLVADKDIAQKVSDFFKKIYLDDVFIYVLLFLLGASAAAGPIATARRSEYSGSRTALEISDKRPVQSVTAGVALTMISVVYVLFGALQFRYFFMPQDTMASALGLTSSVYAVRGFGELLFITCLNFIIMAVSMRFTKQKDGKTQGYLKAVYTLLIAFNFVIMASSHMRLAYYEVSFGFTVARFVSHSFMILLVILNLIMLARVYFEKLKVIKLFAIAALLYYCAVAAVGPEQYVAQYNIQRYETNGKIDMEYLFSLSGGAVSKACDFAIAHPEVFDEQAKSAAREKYKMYAARQNYGWQSLNLADETAYHKLAQLP